MISKTLTPKGFRALTKHRAKEVPVANSQTVETLNSNLRKEVSKKSRVMRTQMLVQTSNAK